MRKSVITRLVVSALMITCLLIKPISVSAAENATNKTTKLSMMVGTVAVVDALNKPLKAYNNMVIPSGYYTVTGPSSYAWISIDDNKLVKLDSLSKTRVIKNDKNTVVDLVSGNAFLDASKNLEKGETLMIRTQNIIAPVMGTSAEIKVDSGKTQIVCLDGKINGFIIDAKNGQTKPIEVSAGKNVSVENTDKGVNIKSNPVTKKDISGFTKLQVVQNPLLKERVIGALGEKIGNIDLMDAITSTQQEIRAQISKIETVSNSTLGDKQSAINTILGVDISEKTLSIPVITSTPSQVSSTASSSSSDDKKDKEEENNKEHTHDWALAEIQKEATCTEDGITLYKCKNCSETKTDSIEATGHHEWEFVKTQKEATCTEDGITLYKCKNCTETKTDSIKATGHHEWEFVKTQKEATCTEDGITLYKCKNCSETKTDSIKATGHHEWEFVKIQKEATCTEDGITLYKCKNCSETKTDSIEATGHEWEFVENQEEPTCTEEGIALYKCKNCSETKTDSVKSLGHNLIGDIEERIVEGADSYNCADIEIGSFRLCSRCDNMVEVSRRKKYDKHSKIENLEKGTEPTCTDDRKVYYYCDHELINIQDKHCTYICEEFEPNTALGHKVSEDDIPTKKTDEKISIQCVRFDNCGCSAEYIWNNDDQKYQFYRWK